ncbi:MAG: tRNA nucleotidyltransferase [Pseudoflavonifractor sp.]|nr:tRNA nucleotidyltransferase [Pseudoflavonifractor sp.]
MTWSELPSGPGACLDCLWASGWAAYPVGGCVRDLLLGRTPGDVDICTAARPETVLALFPDAVPTGLKHGTVTVPTPDGPVEITTFRREGGYADGRHPGTVTFDAGLVEDLSRRDFTVNAMALAPDGTVIDCFGGREDLARGVIRCVGEPDRRFSEDALRMLRGVRFCAQLGFTLEEQTAAAMDRNALRAAQISRERIRAELEKTLLSPHPQRAGKLIRLGLLNHLYAFDRPWDLSCLSDLPALPEERWRGFCAATGFPIGALPVERKLRRAVEHPELAIIPTLALSGGALMALGLSGPEIGTAQKCLARHVLEHPEDNTAERLRTVLAQQDGSHS